MARQNEAGRYQVAITDDLEAPRLRKLLAGYGAPDLKPTTQTFTRCFCPTNTCSASRRGTGST